MTRITYMHAYKHTYIHRYKHKHKHTNTQVLTEVCDKGSIFDLYSQHSVAIRPSTALRMAKECAAGFAHIHSMGYMHRYRCGLIYLPTHPPTHPPIHPLAKPHPTHRLARAAKSLPLHHAAAPPAAPAPHAPFRTARARTCERPSCAMRALFSLMRCCR